jgi:glycosyltransferase involved in cell wall biosynthesis
MHAPNTDARNDIAACPREKYRSNPRLALSPPATDMPSTLPRSNRPTTIVVVPCFNEALRLDVTAFTSFLTQHPSIALLFVDDGSTDDTPLVLERLRQQHPKQICTLRLSANIGKAEAVRRGVQIALRRQLEFVGYWDADLATPLDAIPTLREILLSQPQLSLAMGSRVSLLGRQIRRNGLRHFLGRAFATAASLVLRLPVYDTQCGAKLFRATPDVTALFAEPFNSRWIFDVEILARMMTSTVMPHEAIYEYPLERWRDIAGSRLKPRDFLRAALDLASIYWRYMRRNAPRTIPHPATSIQNPSQHRDAA